MGVRGSIRIVAATALVFTLAIGSQSLADTTPSGTAGLPYVALGDSFASGLGLSPATGKPVAGCLQASGDYPHRVADSLGMTLTDVSCAGAVTANVTVKPQRTRSGTAPTQLPALSAKTRVVTITIGGNDIGFFAIATHCIALSANGPVLSTGKATCRSKYVTNGVDSLGGRISNTLPNGNGSGTNGLTATFTAVKKAAPRAKVFVVGYPTILPGAANTPADGCFRATVTGKDVSALSINNGLPFTTIDVSYLNSIAQSLDAAMEKAAEAAGFTYVSALAATAAHSACASPDQSYIQGVSLRSDARLNVTLSTGALHPNARGTAFMAGLIEAAITKAMPAKAASPAASSPSGFATSPLPWIASGGAIVLLAIALLVWRRGRVSAEEQ